MAEWIQEGNHLDVVFAAGATVGTPVQVGGFAGLPGGTFAAGERGAFTITGAISAEKPTGLAFAFGDAVDWDPTLLGGAGACVASGAGDPTAFPLGIVVQRDNVNADDRVDVRLRPDGNGVESAMTVALVANAEAGNAIVVQVQATSAEVVRVFAEVFDGDGIHGLVAAWTLDDVSIGGPFLVSAVDQASLLLDTDATGFTAVEITDVSGVFVGTIFLQVTPMGGLPQIIAVTFA